MKTVAQVGREYGVSRGILLHYERLGLLRPAREGDHRRFSPEDERRLTLILTWRRAGLHLNEVKALLRASSPSPVATALERRLRAVNEEILHLRDQQRLIVTLLRRPELLAHLGRVDRERWMSMLASAGFTDEEMWLWHQDFERDAPDEHHRFLTFLKIPEEEIQFLRTWRPTLQRIGRPDMDLQAFFRLHQDLPREAPGSDAVTLAALAHCLPHLPRSIEGGLLSPRVLVLGCGPGAEVLTLAQALAVPITALEVHPPFLDTLRGRARARGLGDLVVSRPDSFLDLQDPDESWDLLWSEGAVYIAGWAEALRTWRRLVPPGGLFVASEAVWLVPQDERPNEAVAFWSREYPAMVDEATSIGIANAAGWEVLATLPLPPEAWWDPYYTPLEARMAGLRDEAARDPGLAAILVEHEQEIDICRRFGDSYGYVYFVMRRTTEGDTAPR